MFSFWQNLKGKKKKEKFHFESIHNILFQLWAEIHCRFLSLFNPFQTFCLSLLNVENAGREKKNGSLLKISMLRWEEQRRVLSSIQHLWVWVRKTILTPVPSLGIVAIRVLQFSVSHWYLKISETRKPQDTEGHWSCGAMNTQMLEQDQTHTDSHTLVSSQTKPLRKGGKNKTTTRREKRHPWKGKKTSCSSLWDWIHLNYKYTAKYILPRT